MIRIIASCSWKILILIFKRWIVIRLIIFTFIWWLDKHNMLFQIYGVRNLPRIMWFQNRRWFLLIWLRHVNILSHRTRKSLHMIIFCHVSFKSLNLLFSIITFRRHIFNTRTLYLLRSSLIWAAYPFTTRRFMRTQVIGCVKTSWSVTLSSKMVLITW